MCLFSNPAPTPDFTALAMIHSHTATFSESITPSTLTARPAEPAATNHGPPHCPSATTPAHAPPGSLVTLNCSPSLQCCHFKNVTHVESHSTGRAEPAFLIQHLLRVSREESHFDGKTPHVRCSAPMGPYAQRCRLQVLTGTPSGVLGLPSRLCSVRGSQTPGSSPPGLRGEGP